MVAAAEDDLETYNTSFEEKRNICSWFTTFQDPLFVFFKT